VNEPFEQETRGCTDIKVLKDTLLSELDRRTRVELMIDPLVKLQNLQTVQKTSEDMTQWTPYHRMFDGDARPRVNILNIRT
jgi:hypothetical protein